VICRIRLEIDELGLWHYSAMRRRSSPRRLERKCLARVYSPIMGLPSQIIRSTGHSSFRERRRLLLPQAVPKTLVWARSAKIFFALSQFLCGPTCGSPVKTDMAANGPGTYYPGWEFPFRTVTARIPRPPGGLEAIEPTPLAFPQGPQQLPDDW